MNKTICVYCQSNKFNFHKTVRSQDDSFKNAKFIYNNCLSCNTIYLSNRLTFTEIVEYYENSFNKLYKTGNLLKRIKDKFQYDFISIEKDQKILDVGTGQGFLLNILKNKGAKVYGLDIDKTICNNLEKELNIICFNQYFHELNTQLKFDTILMMSYLEHSYFPKEDLKKAFNLLKYGGILYIEIPNIKSFEMRFLKDLSYMWSAPYHVNFIPYDVLKKILLDMGYKEVTCKYPLFSPYFLTQSIFKFLGLKVKHDFIGSLVMVLFYLLLFPINLVLNILKLTPLLRIKAIK